MKRAVVIAISSTYIVITTLVYVLIAAISFELDNASGEENIGINDTDRDNKTSASELVDASCKSPCPSTAEMCNQMCA